MADTPDGSRRPPATSTRSPCGDVLRRCACWVSIATPLLGDAMKIPATTAATPTRTPCDASPHPLAVRVNESLLLHFQHVTEPTGGRAEGPATARGPGTPPNTNAEPRVCSRVLLTACRPGSGTLGTSCRHRRGRRGPRSDCRRGSSFGTARGVTESLCASASVRSRPRLG